MGTLIRQTPAFVLAIVNYPPDWLWIVIIPGLFFTVFAAVSLIGRRRKQGW